MNVLRVQSASIWKQQMESDRLKQQQEAKHKEEGEQQHTGQGEAGCLGTHLGFTQGPLVRWTSTETSQGADGGGEQTQRNS